MLNLSVLAWDCFRASPKPRSRSAGHKLARIWWKPIFVQFSISSSHEKVSIVARRSLSLLCRWNRGVIDGPEHPVSAVLLSLVNGDHFLTLSARPSQQSLPLWKISRMIRLDQSQDCACLEVVTLEPVWSPDEGGEACHRLDQNSLLPLKRFFETWQWNHPSIRSSLDVNTRSLFFSLHLSADEAAPRCTPRVN